MYPKDLVYPTRALVVATPAMSDDPSRAMFTPLESFKEKKAIAAVWTVDGTYNSPHV